MESDKKSLAELRAEVKSIRKELYKPISRSKKADLVAEIERHRGISSAASTKEEKPKEEKRSKPTKVEPKKAEPKKEEGKKVKEPKTKEKKEVKSKDKKKD